MFPTAHVFLGMIHKPLDKEHPQQQRRVTSEIFMATRGVIVEQGKMGTTFFVTHSGTLEVSVNGNLATLKSLGFFQPHFEMPLEAIKGVICVDFFDKLHHV